MSHRDLSAWVVASYSQFAGIEQRRTDSVCHNAAVVLSHGKPLRRCVYYHAGRSSQLTAHHSLIVCRSSVPSDAILLSRSRSEAPPEQVIYGLPHQSCRHRAVPAASHWPHLCPPGIEAAKAPPPPLSLVAEANSSTHRPRNIVRAMADAGAPSGRNR
jgi:hypothetical protein